MSSLIQAHISCVTPSPALPLDLDEARRYIRGIGTAEDDLLESWIRMAASMFEQRTGRPIMRSTWEYWLDGFPTDGRIELPRPPLVSVESVEYVTSDGTYLPWTDGSPTTALYTVYAPKGLYARCGWIQPLSAGVWPTLGFAQTGAVRIRFVAGYAETSAQVPDVIKAALLQIVGSVDQFRSRLHFSEGASVDEIPIADEIMREFQATALFSTAPRRVWP